MMDYSMKSAHFLSITLCFLVFVSTNTQAKEANLAKLSEAQKKAVDAAIRSEMKSQHLVGFSVGILKNKSVVYLNAYGYANRKNKTPMTTKTVTNLASNSKPIIAMLAMQLVEQGKLDLDADFRKYLPYYPKRKSKVTVRQLLCHQSGFPHEAPIYWQGITPSIDSDPELCVKRMGGCPLAYEPGSKYQYSSYAYIVLSAVVQSAGKQPIVEQLNARILKPSGMKNLQLDLPYAKQANWTQGYRNNKLGMVRLLDDQTHYWKHGAGGYKLNIIDFAKWAKALLNSKLLGKQTEKKMWTAQKNSAREMTMSGLGFRVGGEGKQLQISHSGGQQETRTRMVLYPNRGMGIVFLCNTSDADTTKIAKVIFKALKEK